jgi:hypothetical protein
MNLKSDLKKWVSKLRKRIGTLDTEKTFIGQETHRNYMLQMQALTDQKSKETPGAKHQ